VAFLLLVLGVLFVVERFLLRGGLLML